jgi:hypothetical protein
MGEIIPHLELRSRSTSQGRTSRSTDRHCCRTRTLGIVSVPSPFVSGFVGFGMVCSICGNWQRSRSRATCLPALLARTTRAQLSVCTLRTLGAFPLYRGFCITSIKLYNSFYNVNIENTYGKPVEQAQAIALSVQNDKFGGYGVKLSGWQDTLLANGPGG